MSGTAGVTEKWPVLGRHERAAGWRVIRRLLGPLEAVNAALDSPPTPHRRRAMLDVIELPPLRERY